MQYLNQNQIGYKEYLRKDANERIVNYLEQTPFFKWCLNNPNMLTDDLLKVLANIFSTLEDITDYLTKLTNQLSDEQQIVLKDETEAAKQTASISQYNYETIRLLGYTGDSMNTSPLEDVFALKQYDQEQHRGIYYDEKGRRRLEINTFTRYALMRFHLVQSHCGDYYIYSSKGFYKKAEIPLLKQVFRKILDEYDDTMWSTSYESNYIAALAGLVKMQESIAEGTHDLINFTNGIFNVTTGEFLEHSPALYTVNQLDYMYDPNATCPKFEAFLSDVFEDDEERVLLIQQLLGNVLLRKVLIQKAFIFLGKGSNGKSVLAEIITQLIGKVNVSTTPLSKLNGTFAMQNINGKLANISTENEMKSTFNTQDFKMLTSGDMVEIEMKYKNAFSSHISATLIILLNKMMDSDDKTDGYYRRLQIMPFNKTYYELKHGEKKKPNVDYMNPSLLDELKQELPGIMNFALKGLQMLKENNFHLTPCKASDEALAEYKRQQNPMAAFFEECIQHSVGNKIKRADVTKEFEKWLSDCGISNYRKLSKQSVLDQFNTELEGHDWQVKLSKIQGEMYFTNLKFTTLSGSNNDYVSSVY
ncbi:DNA primase family protein [Metalysinibacillus jejuensis]|uniref:DNA primase family protein n=1 Tax=Metalysinibacillus jejuensis TaxID=914327 RepID=UPI000D37DA2E|nr:phage/plasmid primase, P4 family [Metalysinibacillus jejuensis]